MSEELIACIVEGGAERAIIDLLLDNRCLCFDREDLLDADLLLDKAARNAKTFQRRYLSRGYSSPIKVYRILDNPNSKTSIQTGKPYIRAFSRNDSC